MITVDEFYQWERASQDTIDVKRCYIDIAGDLVSGILLSQILYWFLPSNSNECKLGIEREGKMWLAKTRYDWWNECRISPKQFDRSAQVLKDAGLIEIKRFKFRGHPTIHIWLNIDLLVERVNSILTKGEDGTSPKGKFHINQRGRCITETTPEITPKTTTKLEPEIAENPILEILHTLPYWHRDESDALWLNEFIDSFPDLTLDDIRACRDHHDGKRQRPRKGIWKTRLRNWMRKKGEFRGKDRVKAGIIPSADALDKQAIERGLS